jgi:excisionase family DNA binding protein
MIDILVTTYTRDDIKDIIKEALKEHLEEKITTTKISLYEDTLVDTAEICSFLNISAATLVKYRNKKMIPFKRVGRKFLYNKNDVAKAIEKTFKY